MTECKHILANNDYTNIYLILKFFTSVFTLFYAQYST